MRLTSLAFALALSAVAACASSSGQGAGQPTTNAAATGSNTDPNVDCRNEKPIGGMISHQNCETTQDRQLDRQGAQEMHSNPASSPTNAR